MNRTSKSHKNSAGQRRKSRSNGDVAMSFKREPKPRADLIQSRVKRSPRVTATNCGERGPISTPRASIQLTYLDRDRDLFIPLPIPWPLFGPGKKAFGDLAQVPRKFLWVFPGQGHKVWTNDAVWGVLFIGDEIRGCTGLVDSYYKSVDVEDVNSIHETNLVVPNIHDLASVQEIFDQVVKRVEKLRYRQERKTRGPWPFSRSAVRFAEELTVCNHLN